MRVLPNGKVAVATGATTQGQGTRTTLSQIVADQLGCRIEDIVMTLATPRAISQGVGAFASRQAVNAGTSALIAGETVRQQIVALAARALGVPESDIDVEDGHAIARTGNKPSLTFGELARLAQGMPGFSFAGGQTPGLEHTAYFTPPQASYCNGTHVVEVEVDPMTGGVTLLQLHGRARQRQRHQPDDRRRPGAGRRRARHRQRAVRVDEVRRRRQAADHHVPGLSAAARAATCRACDIEHVETPNPLNPLGVKGAGEGGTIPAPAAIVARDRGRAVAVRRALRRHAADAGAHRRGAARGRRL